MPTILKAGVPNKYFEVEGKLYQAGHYDYKIENGFLRIWAKQDFSVVCNEPIETVLNGDASNAAFANEAAIKTWLGANFFF